MAGAALQAGCGWQRGASHLCIPPSLSTTFSHHPVCAPLCRPDTAWVCSDECKIEANRALLRAQLAAAFQARCLAALLCR